MSGERTAYWREYNRKNPDKVRAKKAAYRARNKAKIAAYARMYRAEHGSAPRQSKPAQAEAFGSLRERFAAFRAKRQAAA